MNVRTFLMLTRILAYCTVASCLGYTFPFFTLKNARNVMNHSLTEPTHGIQQSDLLYSGGLLILQFLNGDSNTSTTPFRQNNDRVCTPPDYVVKFFPLLPLYFFFLDISPDGYLLFIIDHLIIFLSAFLHQVLRAFRDFLIWKNYVRSGYRCIPVLSDESGIKTRQQVPLVPVPSLALWIAARRRKRRANVLPEAPKAKFKNTASRKKSVATGTKASPQTSSSQAHLQLGLPLQAAAQIAIETHELVQSARASNPIAVADLVSGSAMANNARAPAYCVRTHGGHIGCTSSPYTINSHGKPIACKKWYFVYAFSAFLEAFLAAIVVVGIATFNGWMAVAAIVGGGLGHLMTNWQAVPIFGFGEPSS